MDHRQIKEDGTEEGVERLRSRTKNGVVGAAKLGPFGALDDAEAGITEETRQALEDGEDEVECPTCDGFGMCQECDGGGECQNCEGNGHEVDNEDEQCSDCEGGGYCEYCDGGGDCDDCDGIGTLPKGGK